jgi:hypothetical protein
LEKYGDAAAGYDGSFFKNQQQKKWWATLQVVFVLELSFSSCNFYEMAVRSCHALKIFVCIVDFAGTHSMVLKIGNIGICSHMLYSRIGQK